MSFNLLCLDNFRNFSHIELGLNERCNVFYGENGSGKTSLLEGIHYLVLGKSFRSHLIRRIVKHGAESFVVFGKIKRNSGTISVGIAKGTACGRAIKVDGNNVNSIIEITRLLPIQLLNHNSYMLLYEAPKIRRQFIDWGLFHVEQSFLDLWRNVELILEQRNVALRTISSIEYITAWDKKLSLFGEELHSFRKQYITKLETIVQEVLQQLECSFRITISYYAGWNIEQELSCILESNLQKDMRFGYTVAGPHRADLHISINKVPARDHLSRGQQKLLLYALKIAQGILLYQTTSKPSIYLIDDILAELDLTKCELIAKTLSNLDHIQLFVTGLEAKPLANIFGNIIGTNKIVHINNGNIV